MYILADSEKHLLDQFFYVFAYDSEYNLVSPIKNDINFYKTQKKYSVECEFAMVTKDFTGWGLSIKIHGSECEKIKYLQISFDNYRCSNNFCFKYLTSSNVVSSIWMQSISYWNIFEHCLLENLPEDIKKYDERKN